MKRIKGNIELMDDEEKESYKQYECMCNMFTKYPCGTTAVCGGKAWNCTRMCKVWKDWFRETWRKETCQR